MNLLERIRLYAYAMREQFRADKAYVGNFWFEVASKMAYNITLIIFFDQLFKRVGSVAGYTHNDFMCMYFISQAGFYICYYGINDVMIRLVRMVNTGSLDFLLLRPVRHRSYLYASSIRVMEILLTSVPTVLITAWQIDFSALTVSPLSIVLCLAMIASGVIICNTFMTLLVMPAFKTGEATDALSLFYSVSTISQMPYDKLPGFIKVLSVTVLPQLVISAAATQVLLQKHDVTATAVLVIGAAGVSLVVSRLVWRYALRQYTSASS